MLSLPCTLSGVLASQVLGSGWLGGPCETTVPTGEVQWLGEVNVVCHTALQQEEAEFLAKGPECGLHEAI